MNGTDVRNAAKVVRDMLLDPTGPECWTDEFKDALNNLLLCILGEDDISRVLEEEAERAEQERDIERDYVRARSSDEPD